MIKIAFVRGKYLNNFEGQNYLLNYNKFQLTGVCSNNSIHKSYLFQTIKLKSISDWDNGGSFGRIIKIISNRTLGDSQILFGLENLKSDFDIFHTADPHYYYSYQLAKLRYQNKIPYLLTTCWETIPFNNETVQRKKEIKQFVLNNSDLFLCYTERAKKCLILEGINSAKIKVINLGVDVSKFKTSHFAIASRDKSEERDKIINILFVGRLVEEKGILELYDSFKKLINNKVKLTIIGEGNLKQQLINKINSDRLNNFVTIESKPYEEMPMVYNKADIFVLPSRTTKTWEEQYGMVLIEAMASGIPVIAYKSGAIPEIVGKSGILIDEGDTNNLIRALNQLIFDYDLRIRIGKMGNTLAIKKFNSQLQIKKIENLYENISNSINKK